MSVSCELFALNVLYEIHIVLIETQYKHKPWVQQVPYVC